MSCSQVFSAISTDINRVQCFVVTWTKTHNCIITYLEILGLENTYICMCVCVCVCVCVYLCVYICICIGIYIYIYIYIYTHIQNSTPWALWTPHSNIMSLLFRWENIFIFGNSQVTLVVKNPPANAGNARDVGSIPELGRSPRGWYSNPVQYSCQENPMDRGSQWVTIHEVAKSLTQLKRLTHMHTYFYIHTWVIKISISWILNLQT